MANDWDVHPLSLVIENGTHMIRAGFASHDAPRAVFPTIVGQRKTNPKSSSVGDAFGKDNYVGDDALAKRSLLDLECPIEKRIITNWDQMEEIWQHVLSNELAVAPEEHPILMTEPPMNPKPNREKMTEIMFETFHVPALYVANTPQLSLAASGRTTGVVVDSGLETTYCVPVYEGYCVMSKTIRCLEIGGGTLTDYMGKLFQESYPLEILSDIKEKVSDVDDLRQQRQRGSKKYELPDGKIIQVGEQVRFGCTEPLFQPSLLEMDVPGLPQMVCQSIGESDPLFQQNLIGNVILSGGNTLFPGLADRLIRELSPSDRKFRVVDRPERKYSVWIGGSILASLSRFDNISMAKEEFDEVGPSIVHRKCF